MLKNSKGVSCVFFIVNLTSDKLLLWCRPCVDISGHLLAHKWEESCLYQAGGCGSWTYHGFLWSWLPVVTEAYHGYCHLAVPDIAILNYMGIANKRPPWALWHPDTQLGTMAAQLGNHGLISSKHLAGLLVPPLFHVLCYMSCYVLCPVMCPHVEWHVVSTCWEIFPHLTKPWLILVWSTMDCPKSTQLSNELWTSTGVVSSRKPVSCI